MLKGMRGGPIRRSPSLLVRIMTPQWGILAIWHMTLPSLWITVMKARIRTFNTLKLSMQKVADRKCMGMETVVLQHRVFGPGVPKQEGSGPEVLGHKVDTIFALGCRHFVPGSLGWQDSQPVGLGREDSSPSATGLDFEPIPTRVALVDRYTRIVSNQVSFVDLAVTKFVPGFAEVGPARVWVERHVVHIASVSTWPAAIVGRTDLAVFLGDLIEG